jgi:MFS family permease
MVDEVDNEARPPAQKRLGPILLSPGYGTKQVVAFLFVICISQSMNEFANVMMPLILEQQLHLPKENQGSLLGMLGATQQFGTLLCILAAGALADMFGRRVLLVYTLTGYFICLFIYPFLSSVFALFLLRFAWGVFFTGYNAGAPTLAMDIPDNNSRGKFNSIVLLVPLLVASAFVLGASRLPALFRDLFSDPQLALIWTFGLVSIIPLIGAASTILFFKEPERRRSPAEGGFFQRIGTISSNVRSVLAYAGKNKKFGVMLFIGSVVRTDTLIIGSFLGLWIVNAGREGGIDAIEATKTAGLLASVRFGTKVLGSPFFGFINDKVDRVALMLISLAMMTLAFAFFGLITDVFSIWMIVAVVLIGFAESAEALASQTLLAQEAPPELRGSSVGVFTFLGTCSLMAVNLLGGYLFDKLGYSAPFLMEAVLHLTVLVIAVSVLRKRKVAA